MDLLCEHTQLTGDVNIPGSKSHTIRAVAIAALAEGESQIHHPLDSGDTRSAVAAYRALGAHIDMLDHLWCVRGVGGRPQTPTNVVDVGNSGTSLNVSLGSAALLKQGAAVFTGDSQIRRRPEGPLIGSLNDLGANVFSTRNNGCPPIVIQGTLTGGETTLEAANSQYLTSLLLNAPLADGDTTIHVPMLHERPYVEMTLDWLARQGITVEHDNYAEFKISGGQRYLSVNRRVPADFSSATFFLCAGALPGNDVACTGLDMTDTQGDRAVVEYLRQMGANVHAANNVIRVTGGDLVGCELDLNATPDALPMMAVLACFARGTTRLVNVPQARIKETDRIAVMNAELTKMGARIEELPDGLVVHESPLRGAEVDGHDDHRVVMSLAIAASQAGGQTRIRGYEAVAVTFPTFADFLAQLGAEVSVVE